MNLDPTQWLETMIRMSIGSTVVLITGLSLVAICRRHSSATRHLAGTLTCIALLVLPALTIAAHHLAPGIRLGLVPLAVTGPTAQSFTASSMPLNDGWTANAPAKVRQADQEAKQTDEAKKVLVEDASIRPLTPLLTHPTGEQIHLRFINYLVGLYLLGVIWGMTRLILDVVHARRLIANSKEATTERFLQVAMECSSTSTRNIAAIRVSDQVSVPMVTGLLRPTVLMPESAATWPAERIRSAIAHEIAHVERRDLAVQMLARIAATVYWPQPLVHLLGKLMRADREFACDDRAIASGRSPAEYARHLLDVASELSQRRSDRAGALAMARNSDVENRIQAVLSRTRRRMPPTSKRIVLMAAWISASLIGSAWISPFADSESLVLAQVATPRAEDAAEGFFASGQVIDFDGRPVAGAFLISELYDRDLKRSVVTHETSEAGDFEIEYPSNVRNNERFHTWVYAPGHAIRVVTMKKMFDETQRVKNVRIQLSIPEPMNFQVLLPDGTPCADARVAPEYVNIPNGVFIADDPTGLVSRPPAELVERITRRSSPSGEATIDCVPLALLGSISVTTNDHGKQVFSRSAKEIRLRQAGEIRGKVIVDSPERFAGTQLHLASQRASRDDPPGTGRGVANVELNAQGEFHVPRIAAGRVHEIYLNWDDEADRHPILVDRFRLVVEPGKTLNLTIETEPTVTLHGQVLFEDTRLPVSGAKIYMHNRQSPSRGSYSDADAEGRYSIKVPPGMIHRQVLDWSKSDPEKLYDYPRLEELSISADAESVDLAPILISRMKVVRGTLRDKAGNPITGRTVVLHTGSYRHLAGSAETDLNGGFEMTVYDWQIRQELPYLKERSYWAVLEQPATGANGPVYSRLKVEDENPEAMVLVKP